MRKEFFPNGTDSFLFLCLHFENIVLFEKILSWKFILSKERIFYDLKNGKHSTCTDTCAIFNIFAASENVKILVGEYPQPPYLHRMEITKMVNRLCDGRIEIRVSDTEREMMASRMITKKEENLQGIRLDLFSLLCS